MKKLFALILVVCLVGLLAGCADATHISINNPAKIMVEKEGGTVAITLTDANTVQKITDVVCQIPLQKAAATEDQWSYRIQWLDAHGDEITEVIIAGTQIRWEGQCYKLGIGVDLSVLTEMLETIPNR